MCGSSMQCIRESATPALCSFCSAERLPHSSSTHIKSSSSSTDRQVEQDRIMKSALDRTSMRKKGQFKTRHGTRVDREVELRRRQLLLVPLSLAAARSRNVRLELGRLRLPLLLRGQRPLPHTLSSSAPSALSISALATLTFLAQQRLDIAEQMLIPPSHSLPHFVFRLAVSGPAGLRSAAAPPPLPSCPPSCPPLPSS